MPRSRSDRAADVSLSSKVGSLRMGARMANVLADEVESARAQLESRPRAVAAVARPLGRQVGDELVEMVDDMARRRLDYMMEHLGRLADLRRPRGAGSLRFERGAADDHVQRAADFAVRRGDLDLFQNHLRTVARAAANAAHNAAVMAIARANPDTIVAVATVVTLDSRTSDICLPRRSSGWHVKSGHPMPWSLSREKFPGRPPWHLGCRTFLTPVFGGDDMPTYVRDRDAALVPLARQFGNAVRDYRAGLITTSQLVRRIESDTPRRRRG